MSTGKGNTVTKRKLSKNKNIHTYFEKIDAISSRCRLCHNLYKHCGNTTNLVNHSLRKHPLEIENVQDPLQRKIGSLPSIRTKSGTTTEKEGNVDDPEFDSVPSTSAGITHSTQVSHQRANVRNQRRAEPTQLNTIDLCTIDPLPRRAVENLDSQEPIAEAFTKVKSYKRMFDIYRPFFSCHV